MERIRSVFCIGRNYVNHVKELGNEIPESPLIFSKPTQAIAIADGSTIKFPNHRGEIHHELEIVILISKEIQGDFKVEDVVGKIALGIDFTLRDEQTELKEMGHPWLKAKGFRNSAVLTEFWEFPGVVSCNETEISLRKGDQIVQRGKSSQMMFDFKRIIEECHELFGLGMGDIIFTGTPAGVGPIKDGDRFRMCWGNEEKGSFTVEM
ncbi:fumarylacetoacetate hydrolase family protein [Evansella tamaricis]|uniref:Fumarylacetoacetate hydrolase family protein n=1 Tax=Evansella tamaricis TaxID=2069301 RepID=A0ABS6JDY2_9BACI|nr:fumarylacetoacetate hydrolase family protein [Evansella tamaricis]MBU9711414.1 fumarylacetoacetate hydrolase family protein [Evansella tamaricis]